ncbi:PH domain-containing protein [Phorcysia thermohydrogeniphila]|uniref:PH (Pleckstrin Homology) domain-containing protein n=1 Tax=Phorcysia thermohydrogeniphila TaxID=936138 RepID=A0A4R1GE84_9BACT|nr:PH domain-containing protein [Phorcysia thermohydrogeniphila]TCK06228.1 PH (Pleckstrin Homology) domain-containing protein [Phorcysia thermohydrogeniphila]
MAEKVFKTDKLTFLSYGLLVVAYALFFGLLFARTGGFSFKSAILLLFILPVLAYFFFLSKKKVVISDKGIKVFGLTGRKEFSWEDILEVSLSPGRKYFIFIGDKNGELAVIDDSTENFKELLREIGKRISRDKLPENYESLIENYRRSYTSPVLILVASAVLFFVILKSL